MYVLVKLLESEKVADGLEGITGTSLLSAVMGTNGFHIRVFLLWYIVTFAVHRPCSQKDVTCLLESRDLSVLDILFRLCLDTLWASIPLPPGS